jgi:hypothetical protein
MPKEQMKQVPKSVSVPVTNTVNGLFKNSLEALLSKGNPIMMGVKK